MTYNFFNQISNMISSEGVGVNPNKQKFDYLM